MEETRVKEDMNVSKENGMVMAKVEDEKTIVAIQPMKRQVIIQLEAVEEESLEEEIPMLEQTRRGMTSLTFTLSILINCYYASECCYDTNSVEK